MYLSVFTSTQLKHQTVCCFVFHVFRFSRSTGLLGMSYAQFKPEQLGKGGGALLKLLQMLKLVTMETGVGENKDEIRVNNLTLINFVIMYIGPQREDKLTAIMMAIQVWHYI